MHTSLLLFYSLHYHRIHPAQWKDRMLRTKALGLNTLSVSYLPSSRHNRLIGIPHSSRRVRRSPYSWPLKTAVVTAQSAGSMNQQAFRQLSYFPGVRTLEPARAIPRPVQLGGLC